ncbi:MAG: formyltransferase family protein [Acidobacteriota bacterium]
MRKELKILFVGKKNCDEVVKAASFLEKHFSKVECLYGDWGEKFPEEYLSWEGDYIISVLSRWIIPAKLVEKDGCKAINFHPGPPEYPGIGCFNFALYDGVEEYGVTCHFMQKKVDRGDIIAVKRFKVLPNDDVKSLMEKSYSFMSCLFYEIIEEIYFGSNLVASGENWKRKPYTRKELNELAIIRPEMTEEEIKKRIRATSFGDWQPELIFKGFRFRYFQKEK